MTSVAGTRDAAATTFEALITPLAGTHLLQLATFALRKPFCSGPPGCSVPPWPEACDTSRPNRIAAEMADRIMVR